jgi:hypothetical protein
MSVTLKAKLINSCGSWILQREKFITDKICVDEMIGEHKKYEYVFLTIFSIHPLNKLTLPYRHFVGSSSPEYVDLDVSRSLKVKGMWTFIMFIWGILGDTWCKELGNTKSSPWTRSTIMFLVMNRIIAQKHNSTAITEKMFVSSAADTSKVVIVTMSSCTVPQNYNIPTALNT